MSRVPGYSANPAEPGAVTMFFHEVGEMITAAATVGDSAARAGVSFGIAAVLGAAVYDSARALPIRDVLDHHAISVILTMVGIGLGAGVIRSLHAARTGMWDQVVSSTGTIGPYPGENPPTEAEAD